MPVSVPQSGAETLNIRVKPLGASARKVGHTTMLTAYPAKPLTLLTQ